MPGGYITDCDREDLRGNDIRVSCYHSDLILFVKDHLSKAGITYISQVLKRNRTLKVLNLSENKLDVQGLISIAEALVG